MSAPASKPHVYFLTITILPQEKGVDVRSLILHIRDSFQNPTQDGVIIKPAFKVIGEAKVIAIVEVLETGSLDALVDDLYRHGLINVHTQPLMYYDVFVKSLQVAEKLTQNAKELPVNNIYWLDFNMLYYDKPPETVLYSVKYRVQSVLTPNGIGQSFIELYKCLADKKVHAFMYKALPEQLDKVIFKLNYLRPESEKIKFKCKEIKSLNDYI